MAGLDDLRVKTGELLDEGLQTGVLTREEHSWRRNHLAQAQSLEALEALVEDLLTPAPGRTQTREVEVSHASQMTLMSSRNFSLADLGRRSELVTLMGSSKIHLGDLDPSASLTLELVTVMGDTTVEVPPGVKVRVDCTPVMGDCHVSPHLQDAGALVKITGVVLMGSLRVVPTKR